MNDRSIDMSLDRDLRDLFAAGPRTAPTATLERGLARAAVIDQRRPRFAPLDRRTWPPRRRSLSDPSVLRVARVAAVALLVLVLAALVAVGARLLAQPPRVTVESAGTLNAGLRQVQASLWIDGRILVQGTFEGAYLFDPGTGATEQISFGEPFRSGTTAYVLSDGRIMLIGSLNPDGQPRNLAAGFLDPASGSSTLAGELAPSGFGQAILVLHDGRVLSSGGFEAVASPTEQPPTLATVHLFDPTTGASRELAPLLQPRTLHEMIELEDGRVLVIGGARPQAGPSGDALEVEVYDTSSGESKVVGALNPGRGPYQLRSVRLADGRVLIQGGSVFVEPCPSLAPPSGFPAGSPSIHAFYRQPTFVFEPGADRLVEGPVLPHFTNYVVALADGRAAVFDSYGAMPVDCTVTTPHGPNPWLGIVDVDRNVVYESDNPDAGALGLPIDIEHAYEAGVLLRDGRLALISVDGEQRVQNAVDIFTISP